MFENTSHYVRYRLGLDKARSNTTEPERDLLRRLAPGRKLIVEIGVFEGASSRVFRDAMDADAELYCIDPFPIGRLLFSPQQSISRSEIARSENGRVHLLRCFSYEAVRNWDKEIDLLYLDADMSFDGVKRDFDDWTRYLRKGGLTLIQGSRSSPNKPLPDTLGPMRLVRDVLAHSSQFRISSYVDCIAVVEKL